MRWVAAKDPASAPFSLERLASGSPHNSALARDENAGGRRRWRGSASRQLGEPHLELLGVRPVECVRFPTFGRLILYLKAGPGSGAQSKSDEHEGENIRCFRASASSVGRYGRTDLGPPMSERIGVLCDSSPEPSPLPSVSPRCFLSRPLPPLTLISGASASATQVFRPPTR